MTVRRRLIASHCPAHAERAPSPLGTLVPAPRAPGAPHPAASAPLVSLWKRGQGVRSRHPEFCPHTPHSVSCDFSYKNSRHWERKMVQLLWEAVWQVLR